MERLDRIDRELTKTGEEVGWMSEDGFRNLLTYDGEVCTIVRESAEYSNMVMLEFWQYERGSGTAPAFLQAGFFYDDADPMLREEALSTHLGNIPEHEVPEATVGQQWKLKGLIEESVWEAW